MDALIQYGRAWVPVFLLLLGFIALALGLRNLRSLPCSSHHRRVPPAGDQADQHE